MRFMFFLLALILSIKPCLAQLKEFAHTYDINLNEEIPDTNILEKEYRKNTSNYNWHYDFSWNIPPVFDSEFSQNIKQFGAIEKRIGNADEDALLVSLKRISPVFYPYIGPMLHTVPGLSGKILDLPGIKETKNQFPKKIASPLANIPNLEFLSPELYIYLMPQIWGEGLGSLEFPSNSKKPHNLPPVKIKKEFMQKVLSLAPSSEFAVNKSQKAQSQGVRHYTATPETPLSQADVIAFMQTLSPLNKFQKENQNEIKFIGITALINYWEEKNGINRNVSFLKNVVNPCQAIARKVQWLNLRNDFQKIIGAQAFGLDDWAYTCDKTIKAFRAASQNSAYITTMNLLKKGYFYKMIDRTGYYTPQEKETHKYFIEATIQLFTSNRNDIDAVRPYIKQLREKLTDFDVNMLGSPLIMP